MLREAPWRTRLHSKKNRRRNRRGQKLPKRASPAGRMFWTKRDDAQAAHSPDPALFERSGYSAASLPTSPAPASKLTKSASADSRFGGNSSGLFDRFASSEMSRQKLVNSETQTSIMRLHRIKLVCYVNREVNCGRSCVVQLPDAEDTLEEVIAYIQRRMQLEKRMLYAKKLYTPNGTQITTWDALAKAAKQEIPIIVACGEPFDPTTVPTSMVAFQEHGGGRIAAQQCKQELQQRRKKAAHLKADQVRASGHGTTASAARSAKIDAIERNHDQASQMRHEFMENLLLRAAQQEQLISSVKANHEKARSERQARAQKTDHFARDRALEHAEERKRSQTYNIYVKQQLLQDQANEKAERARQIREKRKEGAQMVKERLAEQRRVAGIQRRVSHITRAVQKAELEEIQLKMRQQQREAIKGNR